MSDTANHEIDSNPRKFVAFGRLLGGLFVSLIGGISMHLSTSPELTAFATVASVCGLVLNLWGFFGTVFYPTSTREDRVWAWLFMLLLLMSIAGNLYFNAFDYGIHFGR
jgi:hypothetical protein